MADNDDSDKGRVHQMRLVVYLLHFIERNWRQSYILIRWVHHISHRNSGYHLAIDHNCALVLPLHTSEVILFWLLGGLQSRDSVSELKRPGSLVWVPQMPPGAALPNTGPESGKAEKKYTGKCP